MRPGALSIGRSVIPHSAFRISANYHRPEQANSAQIGTNMLLIITSTSDELLRDVNIDDFKCPWTIKYWLLCDFWAIFRCKSGNYDEMGGDRPRLPANRNCYKLSRISWALAQISCFINLATFFLLLEQLPAQLFYHNSTRHGRQSRNSLVSSNKSVVKTSHFSSAGTSSFCSSGQVYLS